MSGKKKKPGFTLMREVGLRCHVIVYVLSIIQISVNVKIKLKYRCRNTVYRNERHQSVFCYGKIM